MNKIKFERNTTSLGANYKSEFVPILGDNISIWVYIDIATKRYIATFGKGELMKFEKDKYGIYRFTGKTEKQAARKAIKFTEKYVKFLEKNL